MYINGDERKVEAKHQFLTHFFGGVVGGFMVISQIFVWMRRIMGSNFLFSIEWVFSNKQWPAGESPMTFFELFLM